MSDLYQEEFSDYMDEDGYCSLCGEDYSGESHYHCTRCGRQCSMMGHSTNYCKKNGPGALRHYCCPGNCQLEHPEEFQADIDMFIRLGHEQLTDEPRRVLDWIEANGTTVG